MKVVTPKSGSSDCAPSFTHFFETELRKSKKAVEKSGVEMVDLQGMEDEHERPKALSRRLEEYLMKTLRVKEAKEKTAWKEMKNSRGLWRMKIRRRKRR